jgi:valacyclovir hydrolase
MAWFDYDGGRIYYEEEGLGSPVLFLPGWSQSISEFLEFTGPLQKKHRVIAADLPGSGKSGPQPRVYTSTYYEDDARRCLDLLKSIDALPAHLVGFSDGGEVELVMAIQNPASVRSVAAWGAAGAIAASDETMDAINDVIDSPIEPLREFSESLKSTYGEANARAMTRSAVKAWRDMAAAGGSISRSRAVSISCPTLLIVGENDVMAPPAAVLDLTRTIPGGEFVKVADAGHSLHQQRGDWLVETLLTWLDRHDGNRLG